MNVKFLAITLAFALSLSPLIPASLGDIEDIDTDLFPVPPHIVNVAGFLSFTYDVDRGALENISLNGTLLINKISLPAGFHIMGSSANGDKSGSFSNSNYAITYFQKGSPSITITALSDMKCSVKFAASPNILPNGDFEVSVAKEKATLISTREISRGGGVTLSEGEILTIRFYESDIGSTSAVADAIRLSNVGAEVFQSNGNWTDVSYSDISVRPAEMKKGLWDFRVSSQKHEGKCLIFHLNASENLSVLIDGHPAEKGTYYDALFSSGAAAVWNATSEENGTAVYVYVPSFTEHNITIVEERAAIGGPAPSQQVLIPVILALLASAGAFFAAIKRRKE